MGRKGTSPRIGMKHSRSPGLPKDCKLTSSPTASARDWELRRPAAPSEVLVQRPSASSSLDPRSPAMQFARSPGLPKDGKLMRPPMASARGWELRRPAPSIGAQVQRPGSASSLDPGSSVVLFANRRSTQGPGTMWAIAQPPVA
eukprot:CAMPEP_0119057078 /NCGR_PEP_ID=MMETSP1178-20130426/1607_1 /TAXON_ID=33656 /ORGANISM="unid sp, Strain CCMP2000" /LENGTH=143 /DNA_ID=CAMNT_0007037875 /DNA_START=145 /DNA_END=576 /DNA_ORIENTATION=-